jgi:hypothetical protein
VSRVFDAEKNAAMFCLCIYLNDDVMTIMIISFIIFVIVGSGACSDVEYS